MSLEIPKALQREVEHRVSEPVKYEPAPMLTPRPAGKVWSEAGLYQVDLYSTKYPVCGTRHVWAVVGRKWVKVCTPIQNDKWRMSRTEWDAIPSKLIRE